MPVSPCLTFALWRSDLGKEWKSTGWPATSIAPFTQSRVPDPHSTEREALDGGELLAQEAANRRVPALFRKSRRGRSDQLGLKMTVRVASRTAPCGSRSDVTLNRGACVRTRCSIWWFSIRDTLWPIPAALTSMSVLVALLLVQFDEHLVVSNGDRWWLFSGGASGARGVLTTIAATSMTVATMAFSILIVALQLGSSQFSPRILRGFTGDRGNQVVLGLFVATFAYSLVVLRAVRTSTDDQQTFVPGTAVTVALVLAFVMIGALIYFFHHATRSIQAPVIIDRAVGDTQGLIEAEINRRESMMAPFVVSNRAFETEQIRASSAGYIQNVDLGELVRAASEMGGTIHVVLREGDHVLPGLELASAWMSEPAQVEGSAVPDGRSRREQWEDEREQRADAVRAAFLLGTERTLEHDIDLGFRQVSDIALKALSPGINDPTTAITCIDRLGELLDSALEIRGATYAIQDCRGETRVLIDLAGFDTFLGVAFDQIRHYGADDATVIIRLLQTLETLYRKTSDAANRQWLTAMAQQTIDGARQQALPRADMARIATAALWATPDRVTVGAPDGNQPDIRPSNH